MAKRRGGDKSVRGVHHSPRLLRGGCEFSPEATRFQIIREEPIPVVTFKSLQPGFIASPQPGRRAPGPGVSGLAFCPPKGAR